MLSWCQSNGIEIKGFVVSNLSTSEKTVQGLKVYEADSSLCADDNVFLISICDRIENFKLVL